MKKYTKYINNLNVSVAIILGFVAWLLLFDSNNYMGQKRILLQIEQLKSERDFYIQKIEQDSNVIRNIRDSAFLVKYARENYLFAKEGEIVYIIEDLDSLNN